MKRRTQQVASNIERAVTQVLARGLNDPRVKGLITVTGVEVTDDISRARVSVTIMPEEHEALTMHGLRAATGHIRRETMKQVHLREMPTLEFVLDEGMKNQHKVMELLNRAASEKPGWQHAPGEPGPTAPDAGETSP
jgi:ribosome-binding factor A